jgi:hypothetical protein
MHVRDQGGRHRRSVLVAGLTVAMTAFFALFAQVALGQAEGFGRVPRLAALVPPVPTALTTPDKIPGQFDLLPSGAATYRTPVEVPPGVAGVEPKLAFVDNSQAGAGPLGLGWSIEGLSAINRCPKTMATDGVRGTIRHAPDNRFCLGGQKLINVGGVYEAAGRMYRTEIDIFSQIQAVSAAPGDAVNGPSGLGSSEKTSTAYTYGGPKAEYASPKHADSSHGLLGFPWMKAKKESTGIATAANLSQQWSYVGQVVSSETRLGSRLLKHSTTQLDRRAAAHWGEGHLGSASTRCEGQAVNVCFRSVDVIKVIIM